MSRLQYNCILKEKMLPENLQQILNDGNEELDVEKNRKRKDPNEKIKSWEHLCTEAKIDLGPLAEFANWNEPKHLTDKHWIYINVPGLTTIIAQYKLNVLWKLERWGVSRDEKINNKIIKIWICYENNKSINYIVAVARENFIDKTKIVMSKIQIEDVSDER